LSNAIKFTNAGSVTLRVGLPEAHTHFTNANLTPNNSLAFTVTDTGIGIAATDQTAIFESFRQVDGSISRQYGGTGLGLSICREFAKLLGGEVFLKSQQGVGSTFTLCLPLEPVFEATPEVGSGQESDWSSSTESRQSDDESRLALDKRMVGKKVLVVDDDMRNLFAMSQVLETSGMSVVSAENGQVALKLLEREDAVDIIVMDIMMPVMDGYQAIRAIRDQPRFKNMPIVALTAQAMPDDRDKCLDAGANEYLTKPIEAAELLSRMSGLLFETEPIHGHSSEDQSKFAGNAAKLEAE
jgi:two-component system chemotaxis sensor kinase CheA